MSDYTLTGSAFDGIPDPPASADFMLDETTITNMFRAAAIQTDDPADQARIVSLAIAAGWTPERLEHRIMFGRDAAPGDGDG